MYMTIKIPLKLHRAHKKELLEYEQCFHEEVYKILQVYQNAKGIVPYAYKDMNSKIAYHSKHNLIQIAEGLYRTSNKKQMIYKKSSTWNRNSFHVRDDQLLLEFGKGNKQWNGHYRLVLSDQHKKRLAQGRMVRLDIIRDESLWYANITLNMTARMHDV